MKTKNNDLPEYELYLLKSFLKLPSQKLLKHKFELNTDYLAGHVSRFLKGERFHYEISVFTLDEVHFIEEIIDNNVMSVESKDLDIAINLIKIVCKILNKYKI